jgi:3-deoxy-D-manno-octulosonic-acid transferase
LHILYSALMLLALPVFLLAGLWRVVTGSEPPAALAERLGFVPRPSGQGPTLWLHAASVGEITSARWIIEALAAQRRGLQILVTCNTATARARVTGWALPGVSVAFAPLDLPGPPARVLRRWPPKALIVVENETWPNRLSAARRAGVPVILIGARLSGRSAKRWARAPGLVAQMLGGIAYLSAQDAASRERLARLGVPAPAIGRDFALKSLTARADGSGLAGPAPRARVLLAASTHEGEEAGILAAFRAQGNFTHLILAPRHPARGEQIAALIGTPPVPRRSQGALPRPDQPVFLADTLGEMDLWYAMSGTCLIGGSLVDKGGHTPYEPGQHGCALLHGPSTTNFTAIFAELDAAGAALQVTPDTLADTFANLSAKAQTRMAEAAAPILHPKDDGAWLVTEILHHAGL